MSESEIQAKLQANIPEPPQHQMAAPVVGDPAEGPVDYELDDITHYKLSRHFGEQYRESDQEAKQQMSYIYKTIAEHIGSREYPVVVQRINELKRVLGFAHEQNARYKLYQWLKLDQKRSSIELEMSNIRESF